MQRYKIQPNDNLFRIAQRFGCTFSQIIEANPQISNPDMIYVGETIDIPDSMNPIHSSAGQTINILKMQMIAPIQIDNIESNALDLINDVNNNDWDNALNRVKEINNNFNDLKPMLQIHLVPAEIINNIAFEIIQLESAVTLKKAYDAKVHANLITGYMPEIIDHFMVEIPPDVYRLEYLGRAIMLNVEDNDWFSAKSNFQKAYKIWETLKTNLSNTFSNEINYLNETSGFLSQAITNKDAAKTTSILKSLLDQKDVFEANFMKQTGQ